MKYLGRESPLLGFIVLWPFVVFFYFLTHSPSALGGNWELSWGDLALKEKFTLWREGLISEQAGPSSSFPSELFFNLPGWCWGEGKKTVTKSQLQLETGDWSWERPVCSAGNELSPKAAQTWQEHGVIQSQPGRAGLDPWEFRAKFLWVTMQGLVLSRAVLLPAW